MAGYQHPDHEVLQVSNWAGLHVSDCEGLEVYDHGGLHLGTPSANPELFSQPEPLIAARVEAEHPQHHPKAKPDKSQRNTRIGGLRKPSFWLAFALGVVIIVAAVVGGVLGGLAKKSPFQYFAPRKTYYDIVTN